MPWFIWFSFLTAPFIVGVAFTLGSSQPQHSGGFGGVIVVACVWLFVAYHLKNYLRNHKSQTWVRWWVMLALVLPLTVLFVRSLGSDPVIVYLVQNRTEPSPHVEPNGLAASAPSRRALSWRETRELVARVQPHALQFSIQLLTSLPPAWWFIAFGIALWKGK